MKMSFVGKFLNGIFDDLLYHVNLPTRERDNSETFLKVIFTDLNVSAAATVWSRKGNRLSFASLNPVLL